MKETLPNIELRRFKKTYLGGRKYRLECFGNPVQMRENGGDWIDIDPTFSPDGKITKAPYDLSVNLAQKSFTLRDKATGAVAFVKLETIFDKLPPQAKVPFRNVNPVISGNKIVWEEVVNGVDAVILAHNTGVSFRRIIKRAGSPQRAQFVIEGDLPIHYQASDKDGLPIDLTTSRDGNLITEDFEAREDQYPIEIDPTLTVQPSAKDTTLKQGSPTTNYGDHWSLLISDFTDGTQRGILESDISEIPEGAILDSATLQLYYFGDVGWLDPSGKTVWAYKLSRTDWVELQATWNIFKTDNNWGAAGGDYVTSSPSGGSTTVPAAPAWMSWNVLAIVQDAYDASASAEFLVKFATENVGAEAVASGVYFFSNDYTTDPSLCPVLVVTYHALEVTTPDADNITSTSSKLHGTIAALGAGNCDLRGFDWGQYAPLKISVDPTAHNDYGLGYPVTYKFSIPAAAVNLSAWEKKVLSGYWTRLPEKTATDFFNGINAVRFDYTNDFAYVSVAFGPDSDDIYLLFRDADGNPVGATFVEICEYYDNRKAVVVTTHDDYWILDDRSLDRFDSMLSACRARNIWASVDIITDNDPGGAGWQDLQDEIDQGYLEVSAHSVTHPHAPFGAEIADSRDHIKDNLVLPALYTKGASEYVPLWVSPDGELEIADLIDLGSAKYLAIIAVELHTYEPGWGSWNATYGVYNPKGMTALDFYEFCTLAVLNARFNTRYAAGDIYLLRGHPVLDETWSSGKMADHLDYIKEKPDVWYVGYGAMYMYHYVQERGQVSVSGAVYTDSWTEGTPGDYVYGVGAFEHAISGLTPDTSYHFRAKAHNDAWGYGDEKIFTTLRGLSVVTTDPASASSAITATINGTLDHDGGEPCDCGFEWGLDTGYGTTTPTESKTTCETFSQVIGGLYPGITYHFRAFATNSTGTVYGADRSFASAQVISRAYALARREL